RIGERDEKQSQQEAAADGERKPRTHRALGLIAEIENERQSNKRGSAEENPERPFGSPGRSERRVDLVDRCDVVDTQEPAEKAGHVTTASCGRSDGHARTAISARRIKNTARASHHHEVCP